MPIPKNNKSICYTPGSYTHVHTGLNCEHEGNQTALSWKYESASMWSHSSGEQCAAYFPQSQSSLNPNQTKVKRGEKPCRRAAGWVSLCSWFFLHYSQNLFLTKCIRLWIWAKSTASWGKVCWDAGRTQDPDSNDITSSALKSVFFRWGQDLELADLLQLGTLLKAFIRPICVD